MEEVLDPDDLEAGADTSVLIDLAEGKVLPGLAELFPAVGLPGMVEQELRKGSSPLNGGILRTKWLVPVRAEKAEDLKLIGDLHRALGSHPPKNAGEAELIALARRHNWIAIIEDHSRNAAIAEGVHVVRVTTLAAAAAACGVITTDRAWGLHRGFHMRRPPGRVPAMGTKPADRELFERAVGDIAKVSERRGAPLWPQILRHGTLQPGQLDELVRRIGRGS
jgi:predicted nucleic acid-binding protein